MNPPPVLAFGKIGEEGPIDLSFSFSLRYPADGEEDMRDEVLEEEEEEGRSWFVGGLRVISLSIRLKAMTREMDPFRSSLRRTAVAGE